MAKGEGRQGDFLGSMGILREEGVLLIHHRPKGLHSNRGCGIYTIGISLMAASSPETAWWMGVLC